MIAAMSPALGILRDEITRDELVSECVVMDIAPNEQISKKIRVLALIRKQRRKVIEETPAFVLAPVTPNGDLARLLFVVEKLLRPGIDADRQRNVVFGG